MENILADLKTEDGQDTLPRQPAEWLIDEALRESFPASDPPCWNGGLDNDHPQSTETTENGDERS